MNASEKARTFLVGKEIVNPSAFVNADGFKVREQIGKNVVLVDFWTYSCINCQRTAPYLNAWQEKYGDKGLTIVGIHTPEFEFEKKLENVKWAVERYGIKYPVALDNEYGTWYAYDNHYWPRRYLIDVEGFIVYDHIGEGGYEATEKKIQELLEERAQILGIDQKIEKNFVHPKNIEEIDGSVTRSPEAYFGAWRNTYLGNGTAEALGVQNMREPKGVKTNTLYLVGDWEFQKEYAENKGKKGKIIFRYQAQRVYLVATADKPSKVQIFKDGAPLSECIGSEAKCEEGKAVITIKEERLYKLIDDPNGWGEHTVELVATSPGVRFFTFTFG